MCKAFHEHFPFFRIPGAMSTRLIEMSSFINTPEHFIQIDEILSLMEAESYMTADDARRTRSMIEARLAWSEENLSDIELWLEGGTPETDSTTEFTTTVATTSPSTNPSTSPNPAEESTTEGVGSLIASFSLIIACILIKTFA